LHLNYFGSSAVAFLTVAAQQKKGKFEI